MAISFVLRPEAVLNSQWTWYRLAIEQDTLGHVLHSEIGTWVRGSVTARDKDQPIRCISLALRTRSRIQQRWMPSKRVNATSFALRPDVVCGGRDVVLLV